MLDEFELTMLWVNKVLYRVRVEWYSSEGQKT